MNNPSASLVVVVTIFLYTWSNAILHSRLDLKKCNYFTTQLKPDIRYVQDFIKIYKTVAGALMCVCTCCTHLHPPPPPSLLEKPCKLARAGKPCCQGCMHHGLCAMTRHETSGLLLNQACPTMLKHLPSIYKIGVK